LATGGIVQSATLALIGEAGPEAVVPLDRAGEFGMGAGGDTYVTINVQGGDPQAVVNALVRWSRQNGVLPSAIRVS
jgi:SLT domain-containing protein